MNQPAASTMADNPWLHLPLTGVHLIEASAGTGKTFTLATLFSRMVIECQLKVSQIVTVTFTDAAAQELRKRIRERLALAARLARSAPDAGAAHEERLTWCILQQHLLRSGESAPALARRVQMAADDIDRAAISTIHGFCARILSEHALDTDYGFVRAQLIPHPRELDTAVANDLWRHYASNAATLEPLLRLWNAPKQLAASIAPLTGSLPLFPPCPDAQDEQDLTPQLAASAHALAAGVRGHGENYVRQVLAAIAADILNKTSYRHAAINAVFARLQAWATVPDADFRELATDHLEKLTLDALGNGTKKAHAGKTPLSPLQPLLADYLSLHSRWQSRQQQCALALLHRVRDDARAQMGAIKQQRRVYTHDDLIGYVADALHGDSAAVLAAALRRQYAVALVDEFQDTDARQWEIFRRVFADGGQPALFLIGDPKQAIYSFRGGDIHTYLRARQSASPAPALDHNFRSRPCVLRALELLYRTAGEAAFGNTGIRFVAVKPGDACRDSDYLLNGAPAPALTLRWIQSEDHAPLTADASRAAATSACVADIAGVLVAARAGNALIGGRPVAPGDMAVLVRSHSEAARMQRALALANIPAVAAGKLSLFATTEAREVYTLLAAIVAVSDAHLLRAALATVLLGLDAAAVAALDADALNDWQRRSVAWRERWQRGGVVSLVAAVCADNAQRLLQLTDGERRLTNYLQLGEHLQEASITVPGLHGLLDWLEEQIAGADPDEETQLLRLESDARRVQIVTLHKSKGLEYPLVYLPFVGIGNRGADASDWRMVDDQGQRVLHWKIDKDSPDWKRAAAQAREDRDSEQARLLYVGLTRAVQALWIAAGDVHEGKASPLAPMLDGHLESLAAHPDITVVVGSTEPAPAPLPAEPVPVPPAPRRARYSVVADWWIYSFSQLVRTDAGGSNPGSPDETAAGDEPAATAALAGMAGNDLRFSGSRFGNALHRALETVDFSAWTRWQAHAPAPEGQETPLCRALREHGYHGAEETDGLELLTRLVGNTLTTTLPEGGALCDLEPAHRRAELEFHFPLESASIPRLVALLHAHGVMRGRSRFGNRQRLAGLMTGKIDLTYVRDGRWHVLDYKSSRLAQYDAPALAHAMHHSDYDVQALIYTLAIHRWLRFRLGPDYDYSRDFGGIRYLFCRGLHAAADGTSTGIVAQRFAPELVAALDALLAGREPRA